MKTTIIIRSEEGDLRIEKAIDYFAFRQSRLLYMEIDNIVSDHDLSLSQAVAEREEK